MKFKITTTNVQEVEAQNKEEAIKIANVTNDCQIEEILEPHYSLKQFSSILQQMELDLAQAKKRVEDKKLSTWETEQKKLDEIIAYLEENIYPLASKIKTYHCECWIRGNIYLCQDHCNGSSWWTLIEFRTPEFKTTNYSDYKHKDSLSGHYNIEHNTLLRYFIHNWEELRPELELNLVKALQKQYEEDIAAANKEYNKY